MGETIYLMLNKVSRESLSDPYDMFEADNFLLQDSKTKKLKISDGLDIDSDLMNVCNILFCISCSL